jgi:DNA primase
MKRSVFDTTTIQDVLRFAGYAVTSDIRKLMKCPLHKDDSPSFRAFERGYCCFGCGAKGGIADLVIALGKATSRAEAARWIERHVR